MPSTAPAARRPAVSAYEAKRAVRQIGNIFNLSVQCGLNFQAFANLGQIWILNVAANVNFQPLLPAYLGRFRWGDTLEVVFPAPSQGTLLSTSPELTVYLDGGGGVRTVPLWSWDGGQTFQANIVLSQQIPLGRLTVGTVLLYTTGSYALGQQFDVVPGGDQGSAVIAIYAHEGALGRTTLAQLRSGQLVQGKSPWIQT